MLDQYLKFFRRVGDLHLYLGPINFQSLDMSLSNTKALPTQGRVKKFGGIKFAI